MAYSNFSWAKFFAQPISYLTDGKSYYHYPEYNGTQLKLTLGGGLESWRDDQSYLLFNSKNAVDIFYSDIWYSNNDTSTYDTLSADTWVYHNQFEPQNTSYTSLPGIRDNSTTPLNLGTEYYPGVSTVGSARGIEHQSVPYAGSPAHIEVEYVDNTSSTEYGYCGYTSIPQVEIEIYGPGTGRSLGNLYFTAGVFKKSANLSNIAITDIIYGILVKPQGSDLKASVVIDGVETYSSVYTNGICTSIGIGLYDDLWMNRLTYDNLNGVPGLFPVAPYLYGWFVTENGTGITSQFPGSSVIPNSLLLKTEDVKVGYYAAPTEPKTLDGFGNPSIVVWSNIAMDTNPMWEKEVTEIYIPNRVKPTLSQIRYHSPVDKYGRIIDNIPLSDLLTRDLEVSQAITPIDSISSTPEFLGQRALVNSKMYIAVDTLSPSDWVQFK